jgi:hypothetical protein
MPRALLALLVVVVLAFPLASGASGTGAASATRVTAEAAAKISLRGRQGDHGPWKRYLWLKLVKVRLTSFSVCAVWNQEVLTPTCRAAPGSKLPRGTVMRLEQRLPRVGSRRAGSPGWRTVGISPDAVLQAVLSNAVAGNRPGRVSYRVTLRNASGRVLETSNTFKVFWNK